MSLPNNAIRFPAPSIDFPTDVGVTGQDHDSYPAGNQQPRFDWMRMYLIGLLSCQSSFTAPTEKRIGTPWFDLNTYEYKHWDGETWARLAEAIVLGVDSAGERITLADIYGTITTLIGSKPTGTFSGSSSNDGITSIPIPESMRSLGGVGSKPFVYVNGLLLDPRLCSYSSSNLPISVNLSGGAAVNSGDAFTVVMLGVNSSYAPDTSVVV